MNLVLLFSPFCQKFSVIFFFSKAVPVNIYKYKLPASF